MNTNEKTSSAVNDLLVINNDRYEGYQKAADQIKDPSLKELFNKLSVQSLQFKNELETHVIHTDHTITDETTSSGKLYRIWMDIKAALSGHDTKAILSSCERGEDAALDTYNDVIENKADEITSDALMTIQRQRSTLKEAHDMIKGLRDSQVA